MQFYLQKFNLFMLTECDDTHCNELRLLLRESNVFIGIGIRYAI